LADGGNSLSIREDVKKGVFLDGVSEHSTNSARNTLDVLNRGLASRHIGATSMNLESSRSHSVFSIFVESKTKESSISKLRKSQFHFVDLAGSERQKKTDAKGDRLKEGCNINRSLTALGCVINALVEAANGKKVHVRYRDSKLTFLLRDSLGGNSKTAMIANISPASSAYHETLSTLQFAQRAKMIKNRAILNEDATGDCEALKLEIKRLKEELDSAKSAISGLQLSKISGHAYGTCGPIIPTAVPEQVRDLQLALDENISALLEAQAALQCEVSRKEDLLVTVKKFMKIQQRQENQRNLVLQLQEERARREGLEAPGVVYHTFDYETALDNILLRDRLWRLDNASRMIYAAVDLSVDEDLLEENPGKPCEALIPPAKTEVEGRDTLVIPESEKRTKEMNEEKLVQSVERKAMVSSVSREVMTIQGGFELEGEIERLKLELMQSEEERDTLSKSLDYFKGEFDLQNEKLKSEADHLKAKLEEQERSFVHQLIEKTKELENERKAHRNSSENYLKKIEDIEQKNSSLMLELDKSSASISEHNSKIQSLDSRLVHQAALLDHKRLELASFKELNTNLKTSNDSLQAELKAKEQIICQLKDSLAKASENLNSMSLYANVVDNAIVDLKNSMESQTAAGIMEDLISAITYKQQASVMRKALMDRDVLISAVRREVEDERNRFKDQILNFKRDVADIEGECSRLSMLVDIRQQRENDIKLDIHLPEAKRPLQPSTVDWSDFSKRISDNSEEFFLKENQEGTDQKRPFRTNINATNKQTFLPHLVESLIEQAPLSEVQNIPSLVDKKLMKKVECSHFDLKDKDDASNSGLKPSAKKRSLMRASSEENSDASLGKRQEISTTGLPTGNFGADLEAKMRWIIESNMPGKPPDQGSKILHTQFNQ
jgi:DNA repair exonuclease SbcCD ATPase subunit